MLQIFIIILSLPILSSLSTPFFDDFLPDFQTYYQILFTTADTNNLTSLTSSTPYTRTQYFQVPYQNAIDQTNRIQVCISIPQNFFTVAGTGTTSWYTYVTSYNQSIMTIQVALYSNSIITELTISYLISSNLYFNIGYQKVSNSLIGTDVYTGNNIYNCNSASLISTDCRMTTLSFNYNTMVILDPSQNIYISLFISGITFQATTQVGFGIFQNTASNTSFTINIIAYSDTFISGISFYYIAFELNKVSVDPTYINQHGAATFCHHSNPLICTSSNYQISNVATVINLNMFIMGFRTINYPYATTGNFALNKPTVTGGSNWNFQLFFLATVNYFMQFEYLIFKHQTCAGYSIDKYLTLDRLYCNNTCNNSYAQYYDNNNQCQSCSNYCKTCQTTPSTCMSCYNSQNRILNGSNCTCNTIGYYDDNFSLNCANCDYTCQSCTYYTNTSCTNCSSSNNRILVNNSCPCIQGYVDPGAGSGSGVSICLSCSYTCLTCSNTNNNSCVTCNLTLLRIQINASCPCQTGYYDNGVALCVACYYKCLTCSAYLTCITCPTTRYFSAIATMCYCTTGYYNYGVQICGKCSQTCLNCNGPLNTNCTACNSTQFRTLAINVCSCQAQYYEYLNSCYPCDYTCQNCTGSNNISCSSCLASNFRSLVSTSCICDVGYYESGISMCNQCNYTCLTCSINSSNCISCNTGLQRSIQGSSCPCNIGYVDTGVAMCAACSYSCLTCDGIFSVNCLTCNNTFRVFSSNKCICVGNTYDDGMSLACALCDYTCLTCNSLHTCLTCNSSNNRIWNSINLTCNCLPSYFDSGLASCFACNSTCLTCSINLYHCDSCDPLNYRILSGNQCICKNGYFDVGMTICSKCNSLCITCIGISTNCTSCDSTLMRNLSFNKCVCNNGYYDTGSICLICAYSCLTCTTSATICTSCGATRNLSNYNCNCIAKYYDNSVAICASCFYSCMTCITTSGNCLSCNSSALRIFNTSSNSCDCSVGYYDDGINQFCAICSYQCSSCILLNVCTSCNTVLFRLNLLPNCPCASNYFDNGAPLCLACHYSCNSCNGTSNNSCISCDPLSYRSLTSNTCLCVPGYYDNSSAICLSCSYTCLTCLAYSNCTTCNLSNFRTISSQSCLCQFGYYDSNQAKCDQCSTNCYTCNQTATNCLSCNTNLQRILIGNTCVCNNNSYMNITDSNCYPCYYACLTCNQNLNNNCTSCLISSFRNLTISGCICATGYFEQGIMQCGICDRSCKTCIGNSSYNCTSCYIGYQLMTSMCIEIMYCANYYFQNECVNVCPLVTFANGNTCIKCINNCYTCVSSLICLSCVTPYLFQNATKTCLISCSFNQYQFNNTCFNCNNQCLTCIFNNILICTTCITNYYFYNNTCISTCPVNITVLYNQICRICILPCITCFDLNGFSCYSCALNYYLYNNSCLSSCPPKMYANQSYNICSNCSENCINCSLKNNSNVYCQQCVNGFYSSQGICVEQNYFNSYGNKLQCHPNCKTCTNLSFSSCIICNKYRGNNNQMAIKGYCDCVSGTIDLGNGTCDPKLYKTIKISQTYEQSTSLIIFSSSILVGVLKSNYILFLQFILYNQLVSQLGYINMTMIASIDQVLGISGYANFGNLLNHNTNKNTQQILRKLYENSTQSDSSLFTHKKSDYSIINRCPHVIIGNIILWILVFLLPKIITLLRQKYKNIETKANNIKIKRFYNLCLLLQKFIKYKMVIIFFMLTITETIFNIAVSFRFTNFSSSYEILNFIVTIILTIYCISFTIFLTKNSLNFLKQEKIREFKVLFTNFDQKCTYKLNFVYIPFTFIRSILIQICLVSLSINPIAQTISSTIIQIVFLVYLIIFNPYKKFYKSLIFLSEFVLTLQMITFIAISSLVQWNRLASTLTMLGLMYVQLLFFGIFIIRQLFDWFLIRCKKYSRSKNKVVQDIVIIGEQKQQIDKIDIKIDLNLTHQQLKQNTSLNLGDDNSNEN